MDDAPKSPPPATPPDLVAEQIRAEIEGGLLIVGPGQFSPWPGHERVAVLRVDRAEPVLVWDAFHPREHVAALRAALGTLSTVWPGELDMMYATPWSYAWTIAPAPFRLYDRSGLMGALEDRCLTLRASDRRVRAADVASVLGWAGDDAADRGVDLVLPSGARVTVAVEHELAAVVDPTYDGIDLMFDASWVPVLGRSLATALGVDYAATERALT